jgi:P27 family predicted phage terminase small subunit
VATPGRKGLPSAIKQLRAAHPSDIEGNDAPKLSGAPVLPPGVELSERERDLWEWLLVHVYNPAVHGTCDGLVFLATVRLWSRVVEADDRCRTLGTIQRTPSGRIIEPPWARVSRELWRELRSSLTDLGASPVGRVRLAELTPGPETFDGEWADLAAGSRRPS